MPGVPFRNSQVNLQKKNTEEFPEKSQKNLEANTWKIFNVIDEDFPEKKTYRISKRIPAVFPEKVLRKFQCNCWEIAREISAEFPEKIMENLQRNSNLKK